jgi:hypothetical protein
MVHPPCNGFLGRVVDLALYETKVLGLKPPPGGLSKNPRLTFVTFAPVSVHSPHISPYWIRVRAFARMEWGLLVSPYEKGTWFPLRHRTLAKCAGRRSSIAPNAMHTLPVIRQNSPLNGRCDEDLMGQVSRLWICLPADATESQPRYTD